jgi:DNA polymerase
MSMKNCKKCSLCEERSNIVLGSGKKASSIMFIGEAPGANEDKTGIPFCGRAGKILDELLKSVKIDRDDVYITNIVKCRPPKNRDPKKEEIEMCSIFLEKEIKEIKPKVICPLGRFAAKFILEKYNLEVGEIGDVHGKVFKSKNIIIIPLYHPAVAIYSPSKIEILKKDFKKICTKK